MRWLCTRIAQLADMHSRLSSQMLFAVVLLPVMPAAAQTATGPGNQPVRQITVSCPSDFTYGDTVVFKRMSKVAIQL